LKPITLDKFSEMFLMGFIASIVCITVLTYFISMSLGIGLFFFTKDGLALSRLTLPNITIGVFIFFGFNVPVELTYGSFFIILWVVYVFCFVASWRLRENFHHVVRASLQHPINLVLKNFLFTLPIITSILFVLVVGIHSIQDAAGIPTGGISYPDPYMALFSLAYSPIVEEVAFRLSPIGAFLIFYVCLAGWRGAARLPLRWRVKLGFLAFLYPEEAKRTVRLRSIGEHGFFRGISKGEWVIVVLTSAFFGLAHFLSGSGWGPGKVTSAFIVGLALCMVYLAYGAHAPILVHWFFNYYTKTFEIASEIYPSFFNILLDLVYLLSLTLGFLGLILFLAVKARLLNIIS